VIPLSIFSQTGTKSNDLDTVCFTIKELKSEIIPDLINGDQCKAELSITKEKLFLVTEQSEANGQQVRILEKEKSEQKKELSDCKEQNKKDLKKINRMKFFNKVQNTTIVVLAIAGLIFYFL